MPKRRQGKREIRAIDLFCGAGGSSWGARAAGAQIVAGFDRCRIAGAAYCANFPEAKFIDGDIETQVPASLRRKFGRIDLILASPECTNHSPARGNRPRNEKSRDTAMQVLRFAEAFKPRWLVVENVMHMRTWHRYDEFVNGLKSIGYNIVPQLLNAVDFGVPQRRQRLFLICDLESVPDAVRTTSTRRRSAWHVVDRNGTYPYTPLFQKNRAVATMDRARRAIDEIGANKPFLLVYYGTDKAGGWQALTSPLRTVTTLDRFAFVKPSKRGHLMRMLQVPELKLAMGMPERLKLPATSRRARIHMLGNAVCPPVMRTIVSQLVRGR